MVELKDIPYTPRRINPMQITDLENCGYFNYNAPHDFECKSTYRICRNCNGIYVEDGNQEKDQND